MDSASILIPTRNRPSQLEYCLTSILTCFGKGQKVIIGDNGNPLITEQVLKKFVMLDITHLRNPPGSTYVQNLDLLFRACESPWASVMHDDDFFNPGFHEAISRACLEPETDFVFADHWICDPLGRVDVETTERFCKRYGRKNIKPGVQDNGGALAIQLSIALDGFFIRTDLARSVPLDTSQPVATDLKWLIEVCDRAKRIIYLPDRIFTYRLSPDGLTATGDTLKGAIDMWRTLSSTQVGNSESRRALGKARVSSFVRIFRVIVSRARLRFHRKRQPSSIPSF
jgi:glycosyltransferase involved in cell wall biosynthesis